MIQVNKLTKYFGPIQAIFNVSFEVERGEVVGFLGPNGAGKTTTMRILTSFLPATSGQATVAGYDVMADSMNVRRNIGYLPESVPLYPEMRVEEYLNYRAKLKGVDRKERVKRIEFCMDRCRLQTVRRRLNGTLSKGYRQRVGLADAMIHDPPILIMDEPTAGLDPLQIRETLALIREMGEDHTILLSTHILSEVEEVCERVIIINRGRINASQYLADVESQLVIVVEIRGPREEAAREIGKLDGVARVTSQDLGGGVARIDIQTEEDADVREAVAKLLAEKGWLVLRLEQQHKRLEEAFFDALRAEDPLKEAIQEKKSPIAEAVKKKKTTKA